MRTVWRAFKALILIGEIMKDMEDDIKEVKEDIKTITGRVDKLFELISERK